MDQENIPITRTRPKMSELAVAKLSPLKRSDTINADETLQLPSPPSSQLNIMDMDLRSMRGSSSDASRSLISPPPEEALRGIDDTPTSPFTPSLVANSRSKASSFKRKRTAASTSSSTSSYTTFRSTPILEATPNPKPRKQLRKHTRTLSNQSSESDAVMTSPLATGRRRTPTLRVTEYPEHSPSPQTTPTRAQRTSPIRRTSTPSTSRTTSPKTSPHKSRPHYLQSPHAQNPEANYIPPFPVAALSFDESCNRNTSIRRARRSATPVIPPYEPPPDIFTPPKVVVLSPPTQSRRASSKPRMSRTQSATPKPELGKSRKRVTGVLTIKTEMPEIDLTDPAPPPSPTDDPLLLSGPVDVPSSSRSRRSRNRTEECTPTARKQLVFSLPKIPDFKSKTPPLQFPTSPPGVPRSEETPPANPAFPSDLPASSPLPSSDDDGCDDGPLEFLQHGPIQEFETSTDMDMDLPIFNLDPNAADDAFSDSDDQSPPPNPVSKASVVDEGEGEYTGRWKLLAVPTKNDPPSSATRERMDKWGNPISPFPKHLTKTLELPIFSSDVEAEQRPATPQQLRPEHPQGAEPEFELPGATEPEPAEPAPAGAFDFDISFESAGGGENAGHEEDMFAFGDQSFEVELNDEGMDEEADEDHFSVPYGDQVEVADAQVIEERVQTAPPSLPAGNKELAEHQETGDVPMVVEGPPETTDLEIQTKSEDNLQPLDLSTPVEFHGCEDEATSDDPPTARVVSPMPTREEDISISANDEMKVVPEVDSSDESGNEVGDTSVVEITSEDPVAAARAAAILKQHRRKSTASRSSSPSGLDQTARHSRRRSASAGGINKSRSPRSPVMTLPELLQKAERDVQVELVRRGAVDAIQRESPAWQDPYTTPCPPTRRFPLPSAPREQNAATPRVWLKDDWKILDSCFTDERLELGATVALGEDIEGDLDVLADVDDVSLDDVVDRFIDQIGGEAVAESYGDGWSRDNLLRRAKALQDKQRKGHVPPPTIPAHVRTPSPFTFGKIRSPSMEIPDFTPAAMRYVPRTQAEPSNPYPQPSTDLPFQNLPAERPRTLPATLLAPRYSHLLDEAIAVSQSPSAGSCQESTSESGISDGPMQSELPPHEPWTPHQPMTMGKRVKGMLFSYLPSLSKTAPQPSRSSKAVSGLPLPPPDILEKHRKPVVTPVRPPPPKVTHPKELVNLHPAPVVPKKASLLPKREKPKRLVKLHPVTPPEVRSEPAAFPRPRRSSGGSVKDLVKNFEQIEQVAGNVGGTLKRVKSVTELRKGKHLEHARPTWKP
ncbi:hypothetical protein PLEOSDRAFT_1098282 [Pleurotus ostreatus PC15]|uniref:Uncharacterized protein n=1 Tax=Pleurotus ostreatus (strain PC15) TaxID=1137138 RepID=A0A067NES2_PLEO1|nr:hypothetical protein PLEOSDRAFT_1098282 [Pleurotus ostreatus PC15]